MPLGERYRRVKNALRRRLGGSPPNTSPTSTSNSNQQTPNPNFTTSAITPINVVNQQTTGRPGIKELLRVLGSTTGVFPPLRSAVDGLNSCIEIFEDASRGREDYAELLTKLDALLGDLSQYMGSTTGSQMTASMMNLCIGLDQELRAVQEKNSRSTIRRHMESLDDAADLFSSYRRIRGYLERLVMNSNLSMWETISTLETEARLKALAPALSAVYNSAESEVIQRRQCTPGTRENVLIKLLGWAHQASKTENLYWMNGMAGTGKTTIAYSLCAELDKTAELGASFFCSRQIPECRNVKLIIPSIAYQLARFSRPFRYALSTILEADPDVHTRVLKAQFDNLLAKPLGEVKDALPMDFIIVIDALDECENEDSVGQILDILFSQTHQSDLPVRFLLSSRPEPEIYPRMMSQLGIKSDMRLVLHDLDSQVVKHDIETYLRAELASIALSNAQLSALVELSGTLFIFASTAARYIKEGQQYMEHEDRLDTVLGLSLEPTDSKDKEIDKLYTSILRAVFQSDKFSKSTRTRLKTLLDTVICARELMTTEGLAGLLSLKSGEQVEVLLESLSSVVNISDSKGLVTALHASFFDYMVDQDRSTSFHCDLAITHSRVSNQCFAAIKVLNPQFNICGFESSHLRDEEVPDLPARSNSVVSSHVLYACCYWIAHLELAGDIDGMKDLLWDFLSTRLLLWMEVLNVKNRIKLGPGIAERAKLWSEASACPKQIIDLAHDSWRFVTMFSTHVVSQSTPHLYVSMLAFWPEPAPVTRLYFPHLSGAFHPQGTAQTWRRLELLATWHYNGWPLSVSLSPDGTLIALSCLSSAYVVKANNRDTILGPLSHSERIRAVAWSNNAQLLATGSEDTTIQIWKLENGTLAHGPLTGHEAKVNSLGFISGCTSIASASDDKTIRIWDLTSGDAIIRIIEAHDAPVCSISVSPDGTRIASGSRDNSIRLWDAKSGEMIGNPLIGHTDVVLSVRFSPDGEKIASGSFDRTVRVWNVVETDAAVRILRGHINEVYCVAFSYDGKWIASGGHDHDIRIWDTNSSPDPLWILQGHLNDVHCVAFSPDGTRLVSSSLDWTIRTWDLQIQGLPDGPIKGHTKPVTSVCFSPDGGRILSSSADTTICVWDAQSGQLTLGPLRAHTSSVSTANFSADGTQIVSSSHDRTIRVWDAKNGILVSKPLAGHTDYVLSACFSPDGSLIASSSRDNTIILWNTDSQNPALDPLDAHTDWVQHVCFFPDSSKLASGSADKSILIWDVKSGQLLLSPLVGHTGPLMTIAVSPDGAYIASGGTDMGVRLWDAQSGQPLVSPLDGHTGRIRALSFSPDSQHIISGSDDSTLRVWSAQTGQLVGRPILGHTLGIVSCAVSPDGNQVVTGSQDNAIRVWNVADMIGTQPLSSQEDNAYVVPGPSPFVLQKEGWAVDEQSRLLVWVPPDLHPNVLFTRNTLLISSGGSCELDVESVSLGESWAKYYTR